MGYETSYSLKLIKFGSSSKKVSGLEEVKMMVESEASKEVILKKINELKDKDISREISEADVIWMLRNQCEEAKYALSESGTTREACKWYNHQKDMKSFSKENPNWLMMLEGSGEEPSDLWRKYYLNGLEQVSKAKIVFEEFDEGKLK